MWDASLKANGAPAGTSYCLRVVMANGNLLDASGSYPEIKTTGALSFDIVDAAGATVASPNYGFGSMYQTTVCQATTGTMGTATQKIRITNTAASNGWSASIAASGGPTSMWSRTGGGQNYDYNDPSGSPAGCNSGSDGDGLVGQLRLNPTAATITPQSGCTTTGVSKGSSAGFVQTTTDALTLAYASSSAQTGCYWDITGIGMTQQIPANQPSGAYTIDMTMTRW